VEIIGAFQARGGISTRVVAKYDKIEKCKLLSNNFLIIKRKT